MANDVVRVPFSASVQGKAIKVTATGTPGTLVHTTGISATLQDEIWLYLFNAHTADVLATVEFGAATAPDNTIIVNVPFKSGLMLVIPGLILLGNGATALTVQIFAATTNVITANGYVLRLTP